jgi:conjugative transfer region protein (TIGR03748 family)
MGMGRNGITKVLVKLTLLLASVASLTTWAAEKEIVQVARYSTITPLPSAAQAEPLNAVVSIVFPEEFTTADEALHYVLRRSGYRLARAGAADPATSVLAKQPLPEVHRRLGPITVASALTTLAGPAWSMVMDPVHRLVSFELVPEYAAIGSLQDESAAENIRDSSAPPATEAPDCDAHKNPTWCYPL